jgi:putative NIF3 family GTP cyclohydrolase 1 type 2
MKKRSFSVMAVIFVLSVQMLGQMQTVASADELIKQIIKSTGSDPVANTVDVIKAGDPRTPVTGIVTCMFATMDVLKEAVRNKCNLIITHEPVFYNHRDDTRMFEDDQVFSEKKKYIDDNKLVIWRFHDYVHRLRPDGIDLGMARKMGFEKYIVNGEVNRFKLPETTLEGLLKDLKRSFPGITFDVIGKPGLKVSGVMFSAGAPGSQVHFNMLRDPSVDVVIAGEVPQWETYEYIRDAVQQGRNKGMIFLGHIPSEEAGMEYAAEWLKGFIKNIPVLFVECGPSYWTY